MWWGFDVFSSLIYFLLFLGLKDQLFLVVFIELEWVE